MSKTNNKDGLMLNQLISKIAEDVVRNILRDEQATNMMACTVATYDEGTATATLYMPPDYLTASTTSYVNHTNSKLVAGDKVYLLYKYGDISQGWIAHKSDGGHIITGTYTATGLVNGVYQNFTVPYGRVYDGDNLPIVFLSLDTSTPYEVAASVSAMSSNTFSLRCIRYDSVGTLVVKWVAIGG